MSAISAYAVRSIGRAKNAEEARGIGESYAIFEEMCRKRPELLDELFPPTLADDGFIAWLTGRRPK